MWAPPFSVIDYKYIALRGYFGSNRIYELKSDATFRSNLSNRFVKPRYQAFQLEHTIGFQNMVPWMADTSHPHTVKQGVLKRMFSKLSVQINPERMRRFRSFVRIYIRTHYTPIDSKADTSINTWLESTNYTQSEKEDLIREWVKYKDEFPEMRVTKKQWKKYFYIKCFPKVESYPTPSSEKEKKECRGIYARSDFSKVYFGPYAKLMEKAVYYANRSDADYKIDFAKKIQPDDMINYLTTNYEGHTQFIQTDFSSFEGSFTPELMKSCELQLYSFLLRDFPNVLETFRRLAGKNYIRSKYFYATQEGCRMSGEMVTSLANGFTNAMVHLFLAHEYNYTLHKGIVEGDDGVFAFGRNGVPTAEQYSELGFIIKTETKRSVWETKFCSLVFDQKNQSKQYCPYEFLARINWSSHAFATSTKVQRRRQLLVMKAFSYLAQFPRCPVVAVISYQILQLYAHGKPDSNFISHALKLDRSWRYKLESKNIDLVKLLNEGRFEKPIITPEARQVMHKELGMPPYQQIYAEEHFFDNGFWPFQCLVNERVVKTNSPLFRFMGLYENKPHLVAISERRGDQVIQVERKL